MATEQTQAVLQHHGVALMAGDLEEIMKDYGDESVVITNGDGIVKGADAIRAFFSAPSTLSGLQLVLGHVDDEVAFVTWTADGVPFGTDTFIIRDGKIVVQTVAIHRP